MSWDVQTRRHHGPDHHGAHVKARWRALGAVNDVSIECGPGVRGTGRATTLVRSEMNGFSKPIEGDFEWEAGHEQPAVVILSWSDGGEPCQQSVLLEPATHPVAWSASAPVPAHRRDRWRQAASRQLHVGSLVHARRRSGEDR